MLKRSAEEKERQRDGLLEKAKEISSKLKLLQSQNAD
jgi:hypothetical protein